MLLFCILSISIKIPEINCHLDYDGSLNGIIRKLRENYSPLENGDVLKLSASSIRAGWELKNILYDDDKGFSTGITGPGQYIQFDFLENFLKISHYSIKSRIDSAQTKSWKVNASINGIEWFTIHEVINDLDMCNKGKIKTFSVNNNLNFKLIRFISTTSRCSDTILLNILAIEFFGSINHINSIEKTFKNINNLNFLNFLFQLIIIFFY